MFKPGELATFVRYPGYSPIWGEGLPSGTLVEVVTVALNSNKFVSGVGYGCEGPRGYFECDQHCLRPLDPPAAGRQEVGDWDDCPWTPETRVREC